ncbi:MAG: sugar ABC transporter permease [Actinobacteria bacterium]|nr:sugar ABC transporter permease [Actinomycetota bacterium]
MARTHDRIKGGPATGAAGPLPLEPPKRKRNWREIGAAWVFIGPGLVHSIVFIIGMVVVSALISTWRWDLVSPPEFIGIGNYQRIVADEMFWLTLKNTGTFVLLSVPTGLALSLGLALAANTKLRGVTFFRTAYFFPYIASMISVAIVFRWLYNSDYGLLNSFLGFVGVNPIDWLGQCSTAMPAVALLAVWKGLGWNMTLFLAGLQAIPSHLYEAAQMDGAGRWRQFWDITWPLLSPTTFFVGVTSVLGSFAVFDAAYALSGGNISRCLTFYMVYTWQQGFQNFDMGYAAALAWVLFAILGVITFVQFRILSKRVHYELG